MNEERALKGKIVNTFKLHGFMLNSKISNFLVSQLLDLSSEEREKWLDLLLEHIQHQKRTTAFVELKHIEAAIEAINQSVLDNSDIFTTISAYEVDRHVYNDQKAKFELDNTSQTFLGKANMKSKYLQDRYVMLYQRTVRHELFSTVAEGIGAEKLKLLYIENLLSTSKIENVIVLGLLSHSTDDKVLLQDITNFVQLNLTKAKYSPGFFCDGCFVLVEGKYQDGVIHVTNIGFPPPELQKKSREIFDLKSISKLKNSNDLLSVEKSNTEATIVFLSDVRLDIPAVMENLRRLFVGYNEFPPIAIVLMGPFSKPCDLNIQKIKNLFENLIELTNGCDRLKRETDLVLIPSLEDIGAPNILPRSPLPTILVEGLKRKWKRIRITTNPCRLRYCTQEIVVCRADLVSKFCRNTIHFPEKGNIDDHFAQTLICQGHLTPFNLNTLPVYWNYDSALWLYPLPDLIVIGDQSASFNITKMECTVLNTGSFPASNYSFKVYVPSTKVIEDSKIPD